MQKAFDLIARVAPTGVGVLISGETGTGKEIVAQTIHSLSRRGHEAFLPVNCGALSANLIESELFGHERGSFTGAERIHKGYFERANRGTLFLDEITEMPAELQVRLLRVLQTGSVSRVGASETIRIDVRIIAATNQPLDEAVASGRLRRDLFYRLNVFPITLPPLRERGDDVVRLAEGFLAGLNASDGTEKTFTTACLERLRRHAWPGNVRELKNVIQRAFILAEQDIEVDFLLPSIVEVEAPASAPRGRSGSLALRLGMTLADAERRLILATLEHVGGDKPMAAQVLGLGVKTLYNRLREYRAG
jgi:DNA-binding NtrC family response regulator